MAKKESKIKNTKTNLKTNTKNKLTRNGNIYFIIIIVLLIALIFITGFRTEGFLTKVLSLDSSSRNVKSASCVYADLTNLKSSDSLVLGCEYDKSIGYFCDEDLKLKSKTYTLKRDTCKTLNTCFDGIKNQNETQIDCGGVCAPCNSGSGSSCEDDSDCDDGNPCTSEYCSQAGECVVSVSLNGSSCGDDQVCDSGVCYGLDAFDCSQYPSCQGNDCYYIHALSDMPVCADLDAGSGWEFTHTDIGQQLILPWAGTSNVPQTQIIVNGEDLEDGDLVGVFHFDEELQMDVCEGFIAWDAVNVPYNLILVSAFTPILPLWGGMVPGEELIWKVYKKSTDTEYVMTPTFYNADELADGGMSIIDFSQNNYFAPDELTVLKKLENIQNCSSNYDCSDGDLCTQDICTNGVCSNPIVNNGSSCGGGNICFNGNCIEPECTSASNCETQLCYNTTCTDYVCKNTMYPDNTLCGTNMICQAGNCVAEPECSVASDCPDDLNPCTYNVCSSGECSYQNVSNGTSCGNNMVCQAGNCVAEPECASNDDCEAGEICSSGICVAEPANYCMTNAQCDDGLDWTTNYCGADHTCVNVDNIGYSYSKLKNPNGSIEEYSCQVKEDCPTNTIDPCHKLNANACSGTSKCAYSQQPPEPNPFYNGDKICSNMFKVYDVVSCQDNSDCESLISPLCVNDNNYTAVCDGVKGCVFNENKINTFKQNGTSCTIGGVEGVCNVGVCQPLFIPECNVDSQCDDGNPCTQNKCTNYTCDYETNLENGISCGAKKYCQNGNCISGNCNSDDDCADDTFCADRYCDLSTFTCKATSINQGEVCENPDPYIGISTCTNGVCKFNAIDIGLCENPLVGTDNITGIYAMVTSVPLNGGQEVVGMAAKFIDNGNQFCAGAHYTSRGLPNGQVFVAFGDDPSTPEKDGFSYAELINMTIRTNDYICNVGYDLYTEFPYINSKKWYPMSLIAIENFKDLSTGSTNIDFTNTANCTPVYHID